jgi:exopolyphosphatase/guanosine-5'-triphosphate,3'-diphosphate pyrophosphatase
VGGGSTEISWFEKGKLLATRSFKIGTIRLFLDKVEHSEWDNMKHWVEELQKDKLPINCICSGGNINKLTKLYGNRNKNTLSYSQLVESHEILEGYPIEYRIETLGLRADRADVIVPAAIIFKKIMKWGNINELHAPKIGLADGLIVELYKKHKKQPSLLD